MTRWATIAGVFPLVLLLAACGGTLECEKTRLYQESVPGKRIESPEGMDPLITDREMAIPKASPQAPPPPGECVDAPPTMNTNTNSTES